MDDIGFPWRANEAKAEAKEAKAQAINDKRWNDKFDELCMYKGDNGHLYMKQDHPCLGIWVKTQRALMKNERIRIDRKKKLDDSGFPWTTNEAKAQAKMRAPVAMLTRESVR